MEDFWFDLFDRFGWFVFGFDLNLIGRFNWRIFKNKKNLIEKLCYKIKPSNKCFKLLKVIKKSLEKKQNKPYIVSKTVRLIHLHRSTINHSHFFNKRKKKKVLKVLEWANHEYQRLMISYDSGGFLNQYGLDDTESVWLELWKELTCQNLK